MYYMPSQGIMSSKEIKTTLDCVILKDNSRAILAQTFATYRVEYKEFKKCKIWVSFVMFTDMKVFLW
jgi:hypothetical protein